MPLELDSSLFGKSTTVLVDTGLAYFAGLAYGDGYPEYGEVRIVTSNEGFKEQVLSIIERVAVRNNATFRTYVRPNNISDKSQITIALNSTVIRRVLFNDDRTPRYDTMLAIATDEDLAPFFQAGLTDAQGSLLVSEAVEMPQERIFAIVNNDKRLLGISRLSLLRVLRLEPTSVRIRLNSKKGRQHTIRGVTITARSNNYLLEILSGSKLKWLRQVGVRLRHPEKADNAAVLLLSYSTSAPSRSS